MNAAISFIHLNERWVTCCMCGEDTDHTEPADRRAVPIWNGEPTTSDADERDGFRAVCARCYLRWDEWDERAKRAAINQEVPRG